MINYNPVPMSQVELTDDYCVNALFKEIGYLLSFNTDRLLAGFYETAELPVKGEGRYGGWETWLIGGHTLGHYLTACAQAYVNAGVSGEDKAALYNKIAALIDGLLECQKNSKGKPGFIFAGKILDMNNVEIQFDNVEVGKSNIITEAWVPWYTMHKVLAGIVDVYKFTGYEGALTLGKGIGDWACDRAFSWDENTHKTVLSIEYGGMNDALYGLYEITGEDRYAACAHMFDEDELFERVLAGGVNVLTNKHANTTIPKFVGAVTRYMLTNGKTINGETVDASRYLEYGKAFWDMVIENHTYITGANSEWEHFGEDKVLDGERTSCNNETCNVYNMLKLSRLLFEATGDKKYADYYERAYYNSILSSQNPKTGMTTYFQPMASGYFKTYGEPFNKFWCCTGSGMENFTKLNDSIYFVKGNEIYVNLYLSSVVNVEGTGFCMKQISNIPAGNTVSFKVNINGEPLKYSVKLRIPEWTVKDSVVISVNGSKEECRIEKGYAVIERLFADGDVIDMTLPMCVTAETLPDNNKVFGFMYGPVVLSADLGCEDMQITTTGVMVTIPANRVVGSENIIIPDGMTTEEYVADINKYVTREEGKLTFSFAGCDYKFSPHYLRFRERYGIYWHVVTEDEARNSAAASNEPEAVDTVEPGYGQYENDELHAMKDTGSQSVTNDGTYRYALKGGSFEYRMAVDKEKTDYLVFSLRKSDNGKSIKISSGDRALYDEILANSGESELYKVRITIPKDVIEKAVTVSANGREYEVINIRFSGRDNEESARVCEFIRVLA